MFGRVDLCDFVLDHPTISRFHAGTVSGTCFLICCSYGILCMPRKVHYLKLFYGSLVEINTVHDC